jgi:hypothetical protein
MRWFENITDLGRGAEILRRCPYGMIESRDGRFQRVGLRPFPKTASMPSAILWGGLWHRYARGDRCRLYYNQPRRAANFLVLKYVQSSRDGSLASLRRVLEVLDEIARLKNSDALLCDVANWRVSTAIMARSGWEPHCPSMWHRHFIKRFYGTFSPPIVWHEMAGETALVSGQPMT